MKNVLGGRTGIVLLLIVALLCGLPAVVWMDWKSLSLNRLQRQASELNAMISSVRGYYANNVVARVLALPGTTRVVHNYELIPGAIPIPATLSLELGKVISEQQQDIGYRFVSDYPFVNRAPHVLDAFESNALSGLRADPTQKFSEASWSLLTGRVRSVTPVIMGAACVNCHNAHPESPKRDWKVGDVRGIQEVTITEPFADSLLSFKYLLLYFVLMAAAGVGFIALQRQAATTRAMNGEPEAAT
jgi:hypothetical protein